jgi:Family of unknown function (DUF5947)
MRQNLIAGRENAIKTLRRLAQRQPQVEQCEFCSSTLHPSHRHLLEIERRKVVCVCEPCALRFENVIGRWKLIPRDAVALPQFNLTDGEWEGFALPINLAFFFQSTHANKVVAMYPSPAGATESLLSLGAWSALVAANPVLEQMQSDVEALLVNRLGTAREYYIAPIDRCYELAGIIRLHWRGFSGGSDVWKEIRSYFERLKSMAGNSAAVINRGGEPCLI